MPTVPVARGLPTATAASVGRIIARWSYQEYLLYLAAYAALGVDIKRGRVAVRQAMVGPYMQMIGDLLTLRRQTVPTNLTALGTRIGSAKERRDLLAHGVWVKMPNGPTIQDTRRSWQVQGSARITRKMEPAARPIDREFLSTLRRDLEANIASTLQLLSEIKSLPEPPAWSFASRIKRGM